MNFDLLASKSPLTQHIIFVIVRCTLIPHVAAPMLSRIL